MKSFTQFRRELEDVVLVAINSGERVAPRSAEAYDHLCRCPLGCHPSFIATGSVRAPRPAWASNKFGTHWRDAGAFIAGFDGESFSGKRRLDFFNLGRLYRQRFAVKGGDCG